MCMALEATHLWKRCTSLNGTRSTFGRSLMDIIGSAGRVVRQNYVHLRAKPWYGAKLHPEANDNAQRYKSLL